MPSDLIRGWILARVKKTRQKKNLMLTVVSGMVTAGLDVMVCGVAGMTVSGVGVMRRFFMIAGLMLFGSCAVIAGGMLVMFDGSIWGCSLIVLSRFRPKSESLKQGA